jgi:RNA 3'-terminal phosphate cyclase (ATP)
MAAMLCIDGSYGEGGGQIIRTSLALSLITGKPFRVRNVRARREKPGLQRQHLTAVTAAAAIGAGKADGAHLGSKEFTFEPGAIQPGEYKFTIGTAGSTMLVLQAVLPPLMIADAPSLLLFEGGTHNPKAPPFEFIRKTFLPLVNRMGPNVSVELQRYGFYPPGGGRFNVYVEPAPALQRLDLLERGAILSERARALVVNLPAHIGERELAVASEQLGLVPDQLDLEESTGAISSGNVFTIDIESENLTEVFTGVGERGVRGETIAARVVHEAQSYLDAGAPVGQHLADQLLIPLALAGGGSYTTMTPTSHTTTNIEVIKKFLPVEISATQLTEDVWKIEVFG